MIIENERDVDAPIQETMEAPTPQVQVAVDENTCFQKFFAWHRQIRNKDTHIALKNALIDLL